MKKLIKYDKQKSRIDENGHNNMDSNSQCRFISKEKKVVTHNNQSRNVGCIKSSNDVFERLSRPNIKTKLCSKALSTKGVQTDLQYIHPSK